MNQEISDLLAYAALHLGMESADATYLANRLIEKLGLDGFSPYETDKKRIACLLYTSPFRKGQKNASSLEKRAFCGG